MALPTILINAATGSDTAASGAGPATAISGAAGAHTGGSASTTITLPASTDLSGVATDGSHVLWLKTASGRQFSKITGKDDGADTVTVEDSFTIAEASKVDWAIGGKREQIGNADTRTLFGTTGAKPGWSIDIQDDQTALTSAVTVSCAGDRTTGYIRIYSSAGTAPLITTATNSTAILAFSGNYVCWENLAFSNTATTRAAWNSSNMPTEVRLLACTFTGFTSLAGTGNSSAHIIRGCRFSSFTGTVLPFVSQIMRIAGCTFDGNAAAIMTPANGYAQTRIVFEHNVVSGGTYLLNSAETYSLDVVVSHNRIYNLSSDAIKFAAPTNGALTAVIRNNVFATIGGYAINCVGTVLAYNDRAIDADYNAGYSVTSGMCANLTAGPHDVALSAAPFTNPGAGDFSLNATAGGGAACKSVGWPATYLGATQTEYHDVGGGQHADPAGGGGGACILEG